MTSAASNALAKSPTSGSSLNCAFCPFGRCRGGPRRVEARTRRYGRVADLDAIRGLARRLVTLGDDHGDDLAVMGDVGRFQRLDRGAGIAAIAEQFRLPSASAAFSWVTMSITPRTRLASSRSKLSMRPLAMALVTRICVGGIVERHVGRICRPARDLCGGIIARHGLAHVCFRLGSCSGHDQISIVAACLSARATTRLPSAILKLLCWRPRASANAASATRCARRVVEFLSLQQRLRLARPPRHGGDAAERDTRVPDRAVLHVERDRSRRQRELVGLPVARLEIHRARPAAGDGEAQRSVHRAEAWSRCRASCRAPCANLRTACCAFRTCR